MMNTESTRSISEVYESYSLVVLMTALRKHWLLALSVAGAVIGLVTFVTLGMTRIYEARATVMFDPNVPRPLGDQVQAVVATDGSSYLNNKEYYRTQIWMIRSSRVLTEVVRRHNLHKDMVFTADLRRAGQDAVSVEQAAKLVSDRLEVEQIRDSRLVVVTYRDPNPDRAQRVLTTLVDIYAQQNLDDVFESASTAGDWLRTQLDGLWKDLESSEMALHNYKKSKNILSMSMDDQSNMLRAEMQQFSQVLTQLRARRENVSTRASALRQGATGNPDSFPALELIDSPVLQRLRESYVRESQSVEALLKEGKGENHPLVRSAVAARDTARSALLAEVENIRAAYEQELASLTREISGVQSLYNSAEKRALDLNLMEIEYNRLRRAKENNEKLFSLVVERSKETDLTSMLKVNNIRVVDRPRLPDKPVRPNVPLNLTGGLIGGVFLGLIAAIGRERLDRTIKTPDDVERDLKLPFLGLLPQVDGRGEKGPQQSGRRRNRRSTSPPAGDGPPELITHQRPTAGVAEAARAIRTNILFMSPDKPHRTLLVTSSAPAEGKTMVACLLATTMAQAGQKVILIDCDLRRPRIHRVFGINNDFGVTSVMIDPNAIAEAARSTEVPNLSVMTAGPLPPNPAELLQSEAFGKLLERLSQRYDRVIIDSPPVVPVTDAAVLSTRCDGSVLVVRASKTTREVARRGARSLSDVGGRVLGVVLNAVDLEARHYGYYQRYYYYRREGYYSNAPEKSA
jgi:polysaccharide biosynthesis transport protein